MAAFFRIPDAQWAFSAAALVPFIKGFVHLDSRIAQRHLDNRPQMLIETLPQITGVVLVVPMIWLFADYAAVLWLSVLQAVAVVIVSHAMAARAYRIAFDRAYLTRLIAFGWPIWASAFPLIAVYQGDRILIGRFMGMEGLAAYTAAFMMTMVPGLIAAKVANALMLPLLAVERDAPQRFASRYRLMAEATALAAALYLTAFIIGGGAILPLAFGSNYVGLGTLVGWLALMWSMRMLQAVPGAALLAKGVTRPFLIAGIVRSAGLLLAFAALSHGFGLEGVAAAGALAEFASLVYVVVCLDRLSLENNAHSRHRLGTILAMRGLLLAPAGTLALLAAHQSAGDLALFDAATAMLAVALAVTALAAVMMPDSKRELRAIYGAGQR